ncbi:biopolymer transporter ExbD [Psittacicella hinzii]|uniref:Cell division and transport-associated protein TolR n=1 Tax=Psittacicella hinzii TaxID=2028575 RepID=A0A3A1YI78_9GAMM|nr:biopolymer transporter ExbD [Psittacicella hinzii]RIY37862.1 hypothetical protein CKF58_04580 [Psittacicella hinzii]
MHPNRRRSAGLRPSRKTEINMIPFLDVLLTMLLIFMIATPTVNSSIDVSVPQSSVAKVSEQVADKDILVVEVHSDATFTLLFNTDKYTDLDQGQLQAQINRVLQGKKPENLIVQIAADKASTYSSVVNALTLLKQYGIVDVGLITAPASGDKSASN